MCAVAGTKNLHFTATLQTVASLPTPRVRSEC